MLLTDVIVSPKRFDKDELKEGDTMFAGDTRI